MDGTDYRRKARAVLDMVRFRLRRLLAVSVTYREIADECGVAPSAVWQFEQGECVPSAEHFLAYCQYVDEYTDELAADLEALGFTADIAEGVK